MRYLVCLVQLSLLALATARESPHPSTKNMYYPRYRHGMYYERMIPEDDEINVVLHKGQSKKLFFILDSGFVPISLTVTPCSTEAHLDWKISHSVFQNHMDPYHPGSDWANHVMRPPSASPSATYSGRERSTYDNPHAPPGTYILELKSSMDARVQVLLTMRPVSHLPFHPPLPPDPVVQIEKIKRKGILISWKPVLSSDGIEYCVSLNNKDNYNSMCSAIADLSSSPSTHRRPRRRPAGGAYLQCVGHHTWHHFRRLHKAQTYYFDVFAVDTRTNASSVYAGVSATFRGSRDPPVARVKDGVLSSFVLDHGNGYEVETRYNLGKNPGPFIVFVQSCTGPSPVNVHITQGGYSKQEIMSTTVFSIKTLHLSRQMAAPQNSSSSYMSMSIRSTTSNQQKVRVWISGRRKAVSPFPILPEDQTIRVFSTLTTCSSVTLGWKVSDEERVKYCLYRQEAREELLRRTYEEPQNFCDPRPDVASRQVVVCRRFHKFSKSRFNNLIMQKARGLKPGTLYLFELELTKAKGNTLSYVQTWATTLNSCAQNPKNLR